MASTRGFDDTVMARVGRDPAFREALLTEAFERLLVGEVDIGKALLRVFAVATMGFGRLAADIGAPPDSIARMFGPGDPAASRLFAVLGKIQQASGVRLHIAAD